MSVFGASKRPKTPVPSAFSAICACQFRCQFETINLCDGRGSVCGLFPTFHIMLQGHGGCSMSSCMLGLLDVLCRVVKVGQHCSPEPSRRDAFFKSRLPLDSFTHLAHHCVGQRLFSPEYKFIFCASLQQGNDMRHKVDGPAAGLCLCLFDQWRVAAWMSDGASNVDRLSHEVKVAPHQPQHFLRSQWMECVKRQESPV